MARAKGGFKSRRRKKKVLKRAKGYYAAGSRSYSIAREKNDRGMAYAFRDRKVNKRMFRRLWTVRINAAARLNGTTYSRLIHGLSKAGVTLDRKSLAFIAVNDASAFATLCKQAVN
ncbi:MAG: 50S ribosomal protein L20 [Bdellovibrionales bacterium]|nr:50S ribosomal protein L20 [Bdellovibrionales bacterium]